MLASLVGSAGSAPSYAPEPGCEQMIASVCECMELFIIGREYGRLAERDHLVARAERRQAYSEPFDALVWSAAQEFQADGLGLALMLSAATEKSESARLAYWSADLLLCSLGLLDRSLIAIESPVALPGVSMPPTIFDERRRRVRRLMHRLEGGDAAVSFAMALEPVFSTLAQRFDVVLSEYRFGPQPVH
jgi:hypothetical protein